MEEVKKLSSLQIILLIVSGRLITVYAFMPITNTPPANQDMWISELLSGIYTIIICIPILFLSRRFPDMTPVEYSEKILGKLLGKIVGLIFISFLSFVGLFDLLSMSEFLGSTIMPETPAYATMLFMLAACIYTIYKGIDVIGRIGEIFVPFIIFTIIFFILLSVKDMDFKVFLPILADSDLSMINYAALSTASRFYDILILCMAVPNLKNKGELNKIFFISVIVITLLFCAITVSVYAVLGVKQAEHANYPFFTFTRQINLFDFIQRIESINVIAWVAGTFVKYCIYIYFATIGLASILKVKSNKYFIIPISAVLLVIALFTKLSKSVVINNMLSYKFFPKLAFVIESVIPLILLVIYFFRRKSLTCAK